MFDAAVIVPTRDRPAKLAACLGALAAQTADHTTFQVIVVDDSSEQPLDAVVAPFRSRLQIDLIRQPQSGPAVARNTGARRASARLLVFTDDDCEPEPDWLAIIVDAFRQDPDAGFGGHTHNALPDNPYATASQLLIDYLYAYHASRSSTARSAPAFFTSNNLAVSADRFAEVGGFDASFPLAAGEDREFCERWQATGHPLRYLSRAVVRHAHDLSLKKFWRQHLNYGRGAYHLQRVRLAHGRPRIAREPLGFYVNLVFYPLHQASRPVPVLVPLMVLSQVANAIGFFSEARSAR